MRVLGIDPGFDRTGWGVIEDAGGKLKYIACGCIQTSAKDEYATRLQEVRDGLVELLKTHQPEVVSMEQLFFQTNVTTAMKVGMARGVAVLAVADAGLPLVEPTP